MFGSITRFELGMVASLTGLAATLWVVMEAEPIARESTAPRSTSSAASATPTSLDPFQMRPFESFSAFLDRPLFSPSRRPAETVVAVPETEPVAVVPAPRIELTGLIITAQGSVAIVRLPGGDGARRVSVGDTIEGWQVEEIGPGRLLLRRDDQHAIVSAAKLGDAPDERGDPAPKSPP